jgi:hypothetical protein
MRISRNIRGIYLTGYKSVIDNRDLETGFVRTADDPIPEKRDWKPEAGERCIEYCTRNNEVEYKLSAIYGNCR